MIYFDNSATSRFKPKCVINAVNWAIFNSCNPSRGSYSDSLSLSERLFEGRNYLKGIVGASEDFQCIFTPNCTESSNLAILGYLKHLSKLCDLKTKNIVTTMFEHNATARPLHFAYKEYGIEIKYAIPKSKTGAVASDFISLIDDNTVLVCVNHMSNVNGAINDIYSIGKLCRQKNVLFFVDAAQSLGHIKIDMQTACIDMLSCAGHKSLHGVQGCGFLIYNQDIQLEPIKFGGTGSFSESLDQPISPPESYESGTLNTPAILGTVEGAKWTMQNFEEINHNINKLSQEIYYGLSTIPDLTLYSQLGSPVIAFNFNGKYSNEIGDYLNLSGIGVRSGLHCAPLMHKFLGTLDRGVVRISVGANNNLPQVKEIIKVLKAYK